MEISSSQFSNHDMSKLIKGSVVPRPIAWVSTISKNGVPNLAPFSFYTVASLDPVILCFSIGRGQDGDKDTLRNIEETKDFVIHVVTEEYANAMYETGLAHFPETNEFVEAGLLEENGTEVTSPRIKGVPIAMECKLEQLLPIGSSTMVFGKLVHYHIQNSVYLEKDKVDPAVLKPVGRMAGDYVWIREFYHLPNRRSE